MGDTEMTVARFVMDSARLSVSPPGVDVLTSAAEDNRFDSRLAGVVGVFLQSELAIPAVGGVTTVMLPRVLGNAGTMSAVFRITQGIPNISPLQFHPAKEMFDAGYWAMAAGILFGARSFWQGINNSSDQYRWIARLLFDRIEITQERFQNGNVNGTPFAGTVRVTVFQDNI